MMAVAQAEAFATGAHGATGQKRKYTNEPYIVHPESVAKIVGSSYGSEDMIAAAWLHDVVEDTAVTQKMIYNFFGPIISSYVYWLTDVSTKDDGNRATRKTIDRDHLSLAPSQAQTIKLADLIDNTESIMKYDKEFAKVYMEEKRLLLNVLTRGNKELWQRAYNQCH